VYRGKVVPYKVIALTAIQEEERGSLDAQDGDLNSTMTDGMTVCFVYDGEKTLTSKVSFSDLVKKCDLFSIFECPFIELEDKKYLEIDLNLKWKADSRYMYNGIRLIKPFIERGIHPEITLYNALDIFAAAGFLGCESVIQQSLLFIFSRFDFTGILVEKNPSTDSDIELVPRDIKFKQTGRIVDQFKNHPIISEVYKIYDSAQRFFDRLIASELSSFHSNEFLQFYTVLYFVQFPLERDRAGHRLQQTESFFESLYLPDNILFYNRMMDVVSSPLVGAHYNNPDIRAFVENFCKRATEELLKAMQSSKRGNLSRFAKKITHFVLNLVEKGGRQAETFTPLLFPLTQVLLKLENVSLVKHILVAVPPVVREDYTHRGKNKKYVYLRCAQNTVLQRISQECFNHLLSERRFTLAHKFIDKIRYPADCEPLMRLNLVRSLAYSAAKIKNPEIRDKAWKDLSKPLDCYLTCFEESLSSQNRTKHNQSQEMAKALLTHYFIHLLKKPIDKKNVSEQYLMFRRTRSKLSGETLDCLNYIHDRFISIDAQEIAIVALVHALIHEEQWSDVFVVFKDLLGMPETKTGDERFHVLVKTRKSKLFRLRPLTFLLLNKLENSGLDKVGDEASTRALIFQQIRATGTAYIGEEPFPLLAKYVQKGWVDLAIKIIESEKKVRRASAMWTIFTRAHIYLVGQKSARDFMTSILYEHNTLYLPRRLRRDSFHLLSHTNQHHIYCMLGNYEKAVDIEHTLKPLTGFNGERYRDGVYLRSLVVHISFLEFDAIHCGDFSKLHDIISTGTRFIENLEGWDFQHAYTAKGKLFQYVIDAYCNLGQYDVARSEFSRLDTRHLYRPTQPVYITYHDYILDRQNET